MTTPTSRRPFGSNPHSSSPNGDGRVPLAPLLVSSDDELLDPMLQSAALVDVGVTTACDLGQAAALWASVPLIIIGADALTGVPAWAHRRSAVLVVAREAPSTDLLERALGIGAEAVVTLPDDHGLLTQRLAATAASGQRAPVIAVVGGRGGVGASSFAVALGLGAARRGASCIAVDLDHVGGGLDLVVGAEHVTGVRWPDLAGTEGRPSPSALLNALPVIQGLHLLSSSRDHAMPLRGIAPILEAARLAADCVVLDVPRTWDVEGWQELVPVDLVCLLVADDVRGCAAAHQVAQHLFPCAPDVRCIVRTRGSRGLRPTDVADAVGIPLLAQVRDDPRSVEAYDRGEPPSLRPRGPWSDAVAAALDAIGVTDLRAA